MKRNYLKFKMAFMLSFNLAGNLLGATYYVSTLGNDSNNGLSQNTAFKTLQFAANLVKAGDSVLVMSGNYKGFDLRKVGTAADPIVFKALSSTVVINTPCATTDGINVESADYAVIDGFKVNNQPRNGIRVVTSDHVVIKNNSCDANYNRAILTGFTDDIIIENNICTNTIDEHGIYVSNSSDRSIIRNNICHHNNKGGIQINADATEGGDGISSDAIIESNIIYENGKGGGAAINLDGAVNAKIYNNVLYNNHATGIALFKIDAASGSKNCKIFNNTIVHPSDGRWAILIKDGSTGVNLYNNILINQHTFRGSIAIEPTSLSGFVSNYNILVDRLSNDDGNTKMSLAQWQALGYDKNSIMASTLANIFADPATANYHLKANSQAIDKGTSLVASVVLEDLDNKTRPGAAGYDIGAYEFESGPVVTAIEEEIDAQFVAASHPYPNPSRGTLSLDYMAKTPGKVKIQVIDGTGGTSAEESYNVTQGMNKLIMNVQHLNDGLYLLQIISKDKKQATKIALKR